MTPSHPPWSTLAETPDRTVAPPSTTDTFSMSSNSGQPSRLSEYHEEERGTEERRHDPQRHLAGGDDGASDQVSQDEEPGPEQHRKREDAPVTGTGQEPDGVGHDYAHEPDEPAH